MLRPTYTFASPFSTWATMGLIQMAMTSVGKVNKFDEQKGYIKSKFRVGEFKSYKYEFYVEHSDTNCKVRMVMGDDYCMDIPNVWRKRDIAWDLFLTELFRISPGTDFGVTLSNGSPYIMGVLYLGDDVKQIYTSQTSGGTSMIGFLLGGALFGEAGAIVGGMSGKEGTVGETHAKFADSQLARLIYNNGRLWEGEIKKNSKLYNEVMVNLK